jgi:hypothetical protein
MVILKRYIHLLLLLHVHVHLPLKRNHQHTSHGSNNPIHNQRPSCPRTLQLEPQHPTTAALDIDVLAALPLPPLPVSWEVTD